MGIESFPHIMLGFGSWWQIVLILLVVLLVFGARKIPDIARSIGSGLKEFKKATRDLSEEDSYPPHSQSENNRDTSARVSNQHAAQTDSSQDALKNFEHVIQNRTDLTEKQKQELIEQMKTGNSNHGTPNQS